MCLLFYTTMTFKDGEIVRKTFTLANGPCEFPFESTGQYYVLVDVALKLSWVASWGCGSLLSQALLHLP